MTTYHKGEILDWMPEPWIAVKTKFNDDFVEDLKVYIPIRAWDKSKRVWYIPASYRGKIEQLIKIHFEDERVKLGPPPFIVDGVSATQAGVHSTPRSNYATRRMGEIALAYSTLCILPSAPDSMIKTVYRAMSFAVHPDRNPGSSGERFLAVQKAYENICKERGIEP